MGTYVVRVADWPRDSEHVAVSFDREACGNKGAGFKRSLYYERAAADTGDDSVAFKKV